MRGFLRSATLAGIVVACGSSDAPETAEAPHTAGEIVWSNEPRQWAAITPDELAEHMKSIRQEALLDTLPPEHALTRRMQAWADRFHAIVGAMVLEQTGQPLAAPKPIVRIARDDYPNGFAVPVPVCLEATRPAPGRPTFGLTLEGRTSARTCFVPSNWPPNGVAWFNELGACKLADGASSAVGAPCDQVGPAAPAVIAKAPFVFLTTGVAKFSEESAVATLAHELGHYYRAHGSILHRAQYSFWYEREGIEARRPMPVADEKEVRSAYAWAATPAAVVAGQRLHPRIASVALTEWGLEFAEGTACAEAGRAATSLPMSLQSAIRSGAPIGDAAAYLEAEAKLIACAPSFPLDADARWALARHWSVASGSAGERISAAFAVSPTLGAALDALAPLAADLDQRAAALSERLDKNQIGLYTEEQEADDLKLELCAKVGIRPEELIEEAFDRMRFSEEAWGGPEAFRGFNSGMTTDECRDAYQRGFPSYVPIGELTDPHHSRCYRVFNFAREAKAHAYGVAPKPASFEPPWVDVRSTVAPP